MSAQIRKELRLKEAQGRLNLYKYYIPLVISAISESIRIDANKLEQAFTVLAEKHVKGELIGLPVVKKEDRITGERLEEEAEVAEIDAQVVKSNEEQQSAISNARRKVMPIKAKIIKKKIPETLQKDKKQEQLQTTLDKTLVEDTKLKRRKSK
jgi:hypothetical protein